MLDVLVVTAFGRESWLIKKLKESELTFKSIDVTSFFKKQDVQFTVPFGMSLAKEQDEILKSGSIFNKQFQGWSVISDRGVIESNGFLKDYQLKQRGDLAQRLFAHQFSTYDYPFGVFRGEPQTLDAPYSTYECVTMPESVQVDDTDSLSIVLRSGSQAVEHNGETYKAPYLITLLDPYMCRELERKGVSCAEFAHSREIDPLYIWYPFRVQARDTQHLSHMPKQTLLVAEVDKPWLENNFLVVTKEAASHEFVVWAKVVFELERNPKYISDIKARIKTTISEQLKLAQLDIQDHFVSLDSGMSPYPVYDYDAIQLYKKWYDRGVFHCGFEVCDSFNLDEQIRVQKSVIKGLLEESHRDRQIHA